MTQDGKFTAGDIYSLLFHRFRDGQQWLCATEVGESTGWAMRRLDFVAVNCYAGEGYGIHGFEVKISKSDLRRELTDPSKHNCFFDDLDTYSIVAPDYVLDAEYCALVPKNWGIYKAIAAKGEDKQNALKVFRKPLALHDERGRTTRRAFAFGLIRAMHSAFKERNEVAELLAAEYKRGFADGRKELNGTDWRARYETEYKAKLRAERALEDLGVYLPRYGKDEDFEKAVKHRKEEISKSVKIADFVQQVEWRSEGLARTVQEWNDIVSPLIEARKKAKAGPEDGK